MIKIKLKKLINNNWELLRKYNLMQYDVWIILNDKEFELSGISGMDTIRYFDTSKNIQEVAAKEIEWVIIKDLDQDLT